MKETSTSPLNSLVSHYDTASFSIERFQGPPPELIYLVPGIMPLGTAGTLYGTGGTGKSIIALSLSIQVAIAHKIQSKWLGAYPIETGGLVAYFSAEDSEDELHRRVHGLCGAIGKANGLTGEEVQNLSKDNLRLVNLWGSGTTLFKSGSLEPTAEYRRIRKTLDRLKRRGHVRLIVIDTRSLLSGIEGGGNAAVAKEVSYYQKMARDYKATVLIVHHTNKAGSASADNPAMAVRGEAAFLDNLRFGIYLNSVPLDDIDVTHAHDPMSYTKLTVSKLNYGKMPSPIIICRDGYWFSTENTKAPVTPVSKKEKTRQKNMDQVLSIIRQTPNISQQDVITAAKATSRISAKRCREALEKLDEVQMISFQVGERGVKRYFVVEEEYGCAA